MSVSEKPFRLLVVDDSEEDYVKIVRLLRTGDSLKADIVHAETGSEAFDMCRTAPPDCVLLDFHLPDMDGFEFVAGMAQMSDDSEIPVVMLTGMGSEALAVEALKSGAQDYLNKNTMTYGQVVRAIQGAIEVVGLRRELEATKERLEHLAFYDPLTGIGNRNLFADRLDHGMTLARRGAAALAVLLIDLDQFKAVNDTYGHAAGDAVLQAVGKRLVSVLRQSDTATRLGGDEFAAILETDVTEDGVITVARKIIEILERPVDHHGSPLRVGASVGIALFPAHADNTDQLVHVADMAMYRAKKNGGGFSMFAPAPATVNEAEVVTTVS